MTEQFRKICVVTGSRAEYGVMYWVLKTLQANEAIELQMVATGTHMSADHGMTHRAIEDDGFRIDKKIDLLLSDDSPEGVARSFGICVKGVAAALQNLRPDVVVVVGDRYEILAAAQAHKGMAVIEILQNCVIFNDAAFGHITDKKTAKDNQLFRTSSFLFG